MSSLINAKAMYAQSLSRLVLTVTLTLACPALQLKYRRYEGRLADSGSKCVLLPKNLFTWRGDADQEHRCQQLAVTIRRTPHALPARP